MKKNLKKYLSFLINLNSHTISVICGIISSIPITLFLSLVVDEYERGIILNLLIFSIFTSLMLTIFCVFFTSLKIKIDRYIDDTMSVEDTKIKETGIDIFLTNAFSLQKNSLISNHSKSVKMLLFNSIVLLLMAVCTILLLLHIIMFRF